MANGTVSLRSLPDVLRIKSRNDFIVSVVQSWAKGEGLTDKGIAADIAKAQIVEFVDQVRDFHERSFGGETGGNVRAITVDPPSDRAS